MDVHDFVPEISPIQLPCKISLVPFRTLPHAAFLSPQPQRPKPLWPTACWIPIHDRLRSRFCDCVHISTSSFVPLQCSLPGAARFSHCSCRLLLQSLCSVPQPTRVCVWECLWGLGKEPKQVPMDEHTVRCTHTKDDYVLKKKYVFNGLTVTVRHSSLSWNLHWDGPLLARSTEDVGQR